MLWRPVALHIFHLYFYNSTWCFNIVYGYISITVSAENVYTIQLNTFWIAPNKFVSRYANDMLTPSISISSTFIQIWLNKGAWRQTKEDHSCYWKLLWVYSFIMLR